MVDRGSRFLRVVLVSNGVADIVCAAALLILPQVGRPLLGYHLFDGQGALFAGGWAVAALALAVGRIWSTGREEFHLPMLLLGVVESYLLAVFSVLMVVAGRVTAGQAAPPVAVGVVFAVLYTVAAKKRGR
jgi:hypothetical protein